MVKSRKAEKTALGKKYLPVYLSALLAAVFIKAVCGASDSRLTWLLAPTAWWVELLSGISFEAAPHAGYVSHAARFLIAPSCAGLRFFLLVFLMLVFSFLHTVGNPCVPETSSVAGSRKRGFMWLFFCLGCSYLFTVFVNGIRITLAIYLPRVLEKAVRKEGALTPEGLHTMIGVAVYTSSLCMLYSMAEWGISRWLKKHTDETQKGKKGLLHGVAVPVCWYLFLTLGLPFFGRMYRREWEGFGAYALLVAVVCVPVSLLLLVLSGICIRSKKHMSEVGRKNSGKKKAGCCS